jgi:transposase
VEHKNWLLVRSARSDQRIVSVMTLIQSAKINAVDPQGYLQDVLERIPTPRQSDLAALLPYNWNLPIKRVIRAITVC